MICGYDSQTVFYDIPAGGNVTVQYEWGGSEMLICYPKIIQRPGEPAKIENVYLPIKKDAIWESDSFVVEQDANTRTPRVAFVCRNVQRLKANSDMLIKNRITLVIGSFDYILSCNGDIEISYYDYWNKQIVTHSYSSLNSQRITLQMLNKRTTDSVYITGDVTLMQVPNGGSVPNYIDIRSNALMILDLTTNRGSLHRLNLSAATNLRRLTCAIPTMRELVLQNNKRLGTIVLDNSGQLKQLCIGKNDSVSGIQFYNNNSLQVIDISKCMNQELKPILVNGAQANCTASTLYIRSDVLDTVVRVANYISKQASMRGEIYCNPNGAYYANLVAAVQGTQWALKPLA